MCAIFNAKLKKIVLRFHSEINDSNNFGLDLIATQSESHAVRKNANIHFINTLLVFLSNAVSLLNAMTVVMS